MGQRIEDSTDCARFAMNRGVVRWSVVAKHVSVFGVIVWTGGTIPCSTGCDVQVKVSSQEVEAKLKILKRLGAG